MSEQSIYFNKLKNMLELQNTLNKVVDENWATLGREWYRAIWVECAESMEHIGWKWWKKQTPNIPQLHLELVDIFHFGLSDLIVQYPALFSAAFTGGFSINSTVITLSKQIENSYLLYSDNGKSVLENLETYTTNILLNKAFDLFHFITLINQTGLSFDELYIQYIGKNVLNKFRQDHGYKDGSYRKEWAGREDNVHLVNICESLDVNDPSYPTNVYMWLERSYNGESIYASDFKAE